MDAGFAMLRCFFLESIRYPYQSLPELSLCILLKGNSKQPAGHMVGRFLPLHSPPKSFETEQCSTVVMIPKCTKCFVYTIYTMYTYWGASQSIFGITTTINQPVFHNVAGFEDFSLVGGWFNHLLSIPGWEDDFGWLILGTRLFEAPQAPQFMLNHWYNFR